MLMMEFRQRLMKILENKNDVCKNQIINIGNPENECSVKELANILKKLFQEHPDHKNDKSYSDIIDVSADTYYGKGYQDIYTRKPSIEKARKLLNWEPKIGLEESMRLTLNSFLEENKENKDFFLSTDKLKNANARIKNRCRYLLGHEKRRALSFAHVKRIQFKRHFLSKHRAG